MGLTDQNVPSLNFYHYPFSSVSSESPSIVSSTPSLFFSTLSPFFSSNPFQSPWVINPFFANISISPIQLFMLHPFGYPYWPSLSSSKVPCSFPLHGLCICCLLCLEHSFMSPNSFNPLPLCLASSSFSRYLSAPHLKETILDSQFKLHPVKHAVQTLVKPLTPEISYQLFFYVRL